MRSISQSIDVACSQERLFETLLTPTEIALWWNARSAIVIPRKGGWWIAAWGKDEDHPDYVTIARMAEFDPPARLVMSDFHYHAAEPSIPFAGDLSIEFRVEPARNGSRLTVFQSGFPDDAVADEYYQKCCQGWRVTLGSIREFFQAGGEEMVDARPPSGN
jgi:uncharacterized protein YndB with AHSA1/START domain